MFRQTDYRQPSPSNPWLELRLQDGCWIRVRPVDEHLDYYHIKPFGQSAGRVNLKDEVLPVWAAFIRISRLATSALERAVAGTSTDLPTAEPAGQDETGPYIAVERIDHRPAGTKLLERYAQQLGLGDSHEVSVAAGFTR